MGGFRATRSALLLLGLLTLLLTGCQAKEKPIAAAGVIDLSGYRFEESGPISLQGEWAFYWRQLLEPGQTQAPPDAYLPVPGAWNGARLRGEPLPADGYGTYRLRVKVTEPHRMYALSIRYMSTAYRLWVNGEPLAANGVVGTDQASSVPQFLPQTVHFAPHSETIDLVVQVSNFHHRNGGVWNALEFGLSEQVARARDRSLALQMVLIGAILIIGAYHLALYWLHSDDRAFLYFALLCVAVGARLLVQGEMFLPRLIPDLDWAFQLRLEYLAGYVGMFMLSMFVMRIFHESGRPWAAYCFHALWAGLTLATLFLPVRWSSVLVLAGEVIVTVWLGYAVWISWRAVRRGQKDSAIYFFGLACFFATTVNDFLVYNQVLHTPRLMGFGQIGLILIQAMGLAAQYAHALHHQARLAGENARLITDLQAHLQELKRSRRMLTAREEQLRREMAEVLHGPIQTRLLMAAHRLEQAERLRPHDPAQAGELVRAALAEIDQVREQDVRRVSHALHPTVIRVGLIPTVRSLIAAVEGRLRVALTVAPEVAQIDDALQGTLSEGVRLAFYRVLQEALGNVLAHARAERVTILLDMPDPDHVRLQVSDDGCGFDAATSKPGLGLTSINARVLEMDGHWQIAPAPERGTLLAVTLPLQSENALSATDASAGS